MAHKKFSVSYCQTFKEVFWPLRLGGGGGYWGADRGAMGWGNSGGVFTLKEPPFTP